MTRRDHRRSSRHSGKDLEFEVRAATVDDLPLLMDFIGAIETALGQEARKEMLPLQQGDVPATYADIDDLVRDAGFKPSTPIQEGIDRFITWYRSYYNV